MAPGAGRAPSRHTVKPIPAQPVPCSPQHPQNHSPLFKKMDLLLMWWKTGRLEGLGHSMVPP